MGRKLVVVRHGERVDFTFGEEWIDRCFDSHEKYTKKDLNMPDAVPSRKPKDFLKDCPLTQIGSLQGTLVGKGLREEGLLQPGFQIYVSPSLRCVETAAAIVIGMGDPNPAGLGLKIEPVLFEWTGWYPDKLPQFMAPSELADSGFDINTSYEPFQKVSELTCDESVELYYERTHKFVQHLIEKDDNDILLVAHGSSLDTATRQLLGKPIRNFREMMDVLRGVPYCGVAIAEKDDQTGAWNLVSAASANITMRHSSSADFCAYKSFMSSGDVTADAEPLVSPIYSHKGHN
jgi:ubiquitin-associated SH3 domain-containing protein